MPYQEFSSDAAFPNSLIPESLDLMSSRVRTVSLCSVFILEVKIMIGLDFFGFGEHHTQQQPAGKPGNAPTLAIQVPE